MLLFYGVVLIRDSWGWCSPSCKKHAGATQRCLECSQQTTEKLNICKVHFCYGIQQTKKAFFLSVSHNYVTSFGLFPTMQKYLNRSSPQCSRILWALWHNAEESHKVFPKMQQNLMGSLAKCRRIIWSIPHNAAESYGLFGTMQKNLIRSSQQCSRILWALRHNAEESHKVFPTM